MSHENIIELVENDTLPALIVHLQDTDLSTYGAIELHVGYKTPLVKTAVVTDAAGGVFHFTWEAATVDNLADLRKGRWPAEIQITDPDGGILTFTGLTLLIHPEIA